MTTNKAGWIMKQTWEDLLFLHWSVDPSWLQTLLPPQLEVDQFNQKAWVGIVPFEMNRIRLRGLPPVPFASSLLELNVRTYVKYGDRQGVYFFSLDASHQAGVMIARNIFNLPYFRAKMGKTNNGKQINFWSSRTHNGVERADYHIVYEPVGEPYHSKEGDLDFWLTERDRLFNVRKGNVMEGRIRHDRWPLQQVDVAVLRDTLSSPYRMDNEFITSYSKSVTTYLWPFENVTDRKNLPSK
ncbi:MAG: DUF2071 domain-containing protein [Anaerobacillus sp.]